MSSVLDDARHLHVCVVDDNTHRVSGLQRLLRDSGFERVSIVNGTEALLNQLRRPRSGSAEKIDLVLLNERLPETDLYATCRLIATQMEAGSISIIIISEVAGEERKARAAAWHAAGALDVLFNPLDEQDLVSRVSLALSLQRERHLRRIREDAWEAELAERKVMEARLRHLVAHDDLTGLANRRRLEQALELAIIRAHNFHRTNALLYIDLDQFKVVNDAEGHDVGDRMLVEVADLLRSYVQPNQLLARMGSDEFAMLLERVSEAEALSLAQDLRKALGEFRYTNSEVCYQLGASIGVVINDPIEEITMGKLLSRAEQACQVAKSQGRNTVYKFSRDDQQVQERSSDARWVPEIRQALADDSFFLMFQPVMNVHDRTISHYEALVRMRGASGDEFDPGDFIPVAERMGLIHQIDLWVVEHALDYLASLRPDQSHITLSVNLSGHAFQDMSLLPLIKQKLEMTWVAASRLTFEITETAAITNFAETREMVARLKALGCRFALDDFGSGFCSFSYIKNYPVDVLKIDGSFVTDLLNDETDQLLVKSMIDVAHSLNKKIIAEYVENKQTLDKLIEFGIDFVQGHYIGRPRAAVVAEPQPGGVDGMAETTSESADRQTDLYSRLGLDRNRLPTTD